MVRRSSWSRRGRCCEASCRRRGLEASTPSAAPTPSRPASGTPWRRSISPAVGRRGRWVERRWTSRLTCPWPGHGSWALRLLRTDACTWWANRTTRSGYTYWRGPPANRPGLSGSPTWMPRRWPTRPAALPHRTSPWPTGWRSVRRRWAGWWAWNVPAAGFSGLTATPDLNLKTPRGRACRWDSPGDHHPGDRWLRPGPPHRR